MIWLFIILGLMILGCIVMAVKDEKKYGYGKRKKHKKSFLSRIFWWIDDKYSSYPDWS
ncbi:MAG: hypothetical protein IJK46_05860 [Prevotella sp.]|nr:hypothetical protein [Prevotella sp.]